MSISAASPTLEWCEGRSEEEEMALHGTITVSVEDRLRYSQVGQTRVHCDQVEGLGNYAELEVG